LLLQQSTGATRASYIFTSDEAIHTNVSVSVSARLHINDLVCRHWLPDRQLRAGFNGAIRAGATGCGRPARVLQSATQGFRTKCDYTSPFDWGESPESRAESRNDLLPVD
jgi:hypothetical protein